MSASPSLAPKNLRLICSSLLGVALQLCDLTVLPWFVSLRWTCHIEWVIYSHRPQADMSITSTSLALAAFVRCQHSIRLCNPGKILRVDHSQRVKKGGFSFLTFTWSNRSCRIQLFLFLAFAFLTHPFAPFRSDHQCIWPLVCRCHIQCFGDVCHKLRTLLYVARRR